jgi:hypothetical protein
VQADVSDLSDRVSLLENEGSTSYSAVADESIVSGQPVYVKATGNVGLAKADAVGTYKAVGLAIESKSSGLSVKYNTDGRVELADWTAVTGSATLTPGAHYYLSTDTAGMLSAIAPTGSGYVVPLGKAITTVVFDVEIGTVVLL